MSAEVGAPDAGPPKTNAPLESHHGLVDSADKARDGDPSRTESQAGTTNPPGEGHAEIGVSRVEAFNKVLYKSGRSGKILLWLLGISVGLTMFAFALDQGITTNIFTTMATSTFGKHSALAAVNTASQIIRAISKPFIGKLADITSRPTTYVVILIFYIVGFIVAASASTFGAYTVGICFTSVGKSGLDLLSDIIVGDLTPLQWRGFFGAILSVPFVITVPINGFIAEAFVDNWRWGLGMFAILVPVLLLPAIITLYAMQRRGEKLGMVTMAGSKRARSGAAGDDEGDASKAAGVSFWWKLFREGLIDIDIGGLFILGTAFSLILLPFTLAEEADGGWSNGSMIAMLVIGFVLLGAFVAFEVYVAPKPLMTKRILHNRTFLASGAIYTFDQMASATRNTYFSSYVFVIKEWTAYQWTIFLGITTMGLSLVSPVVGLIQRKTHRYKSLMIFGAVAKMIGYGLLVQPNGRMVQDTARLVIAQLTYCLASFTVVGVRVGSQASVPHEDMASIISLLSLWSILGSSIGSAVSAAVWTNQMYDRMVLVMPGVDEAEIASLYGNIKTLREKYNWASPIRQGAIRAYSFVNGHITIIAVVMTSVPLVASLFMPDFYLGEQQNAVTNIGLDGEAVDVPRRESGSPATGHNRPKPFYRRLIDLYYKDS